jgi:hypothetical protein
MRPMRPLGLGTKLRVIAQSDLTRRVVGWSMSAAMTAQLVADALVMAIWRRGKPDALLHHSDRGVACSMSRSGNVWDNAAMESFFSSLKTERTARKLYRTRDEAKADVFDYIERFYNPKTQALEDRLYESRGIREASWISLSGCHPNRVQARVPRRTASARQQSHGVPCMLPDASRRVSSSLLMRLL